MNKSKGKLYLSLAMSLDGYIAKENDDFSWIKGEGYFKLNTKLFSFENFLNKIYTVVMGFNYYKFNFAKDYINKKIIVL